jgi:hypothetical protein
MPLREFKDPETGKVYLKLVDSWGNPIAGIGSAPQTAITVNPPHAPQLGGGTKPIQSAKPKIGKAPTAITAGVSTPEPKYKSKTEKAYRAGKPQWVASPEDIIPEMGRAVASVPFNVAKTFAQLGEYIEDRGKAVFGDPRDKTVSGFETFYKTGKLPYGLDEGKLKGFGLTFVNSLAAAASPAYSLISPKVKEVPLPGFIAAHLKAFNRWSESQGGIEPRTLIGGGVSEIASFALGGRATKVSAFGKANAVPEVGSAFSRAAALKPFEAGLKNAPAVTKSVGEVVDAARTLTRTYPLMGLPARSRDAQRLFGLSRGFPDFAARAATVATTKGKLAQLVALGKQTIKQAATPDNLLDGAVYDLIKAVGTADQDPETLSGRLFGMTEPKRKADATGVDFGRDARNILWQTIDNLAFNFAGESLIAGARIAIPAMRLQKLKGAEYDAAVRVMADDPVLKEHLIEAIAAPAAQSIPVDAKIPTPRSSTVATDAPTVSRMARPVRTQTVSDPLSAQRQKGTPGMPGSAEAPATPKTPDPWSTPEAPAPSVPGSASAPVRSADPWSTPEAPAPIITQPRPKGPKGVASPGGGEELVQNATVASRAAQPILADFPEDATAPDFITARASALGTRPQAYIASILASDTNGVSGLDWNDAYSRAIREARSTGSLRVTASGDVYLPIATAVDADDADELAESLLNDFADTGSLKFEDSSPDLEEEAISGTLEPEPVPQAPAPEATTPAIEAELATKSDSEALVAGAPPVGGPEGPTLGGVPTVAPVDDAGMPEPVATGGAQPVLSSSIPETAVEPLNIPEQPPAATGQEIGLGAEIAAGADEDVIPDLPEEGWRSPFELNAVNASEPAPDPFVVSTQKAEEIRNFLELIDTNSVEESLNAQPLTPIELKYLARPEVLADLAVFPGGELPEIRLPFPAVTGLSTPVRVGAEQLPAVWAVVDLAQTPRSAPGTPGRTRGRGRRARQQRVQAMADDLRPEELFYSPTMDGGSPTMTAEGIMVGGHGRADAIDLAYQQNTAGRYRQKMAIMASTRGILPADYADFERPALVRIVKATEASVTERLAVSSNVATTARSAPVLNESQQVVSGEAPADQVEEVGKAAVPESREVASTRATVEALSDQGAVNMAAVFEVPDAASLPRAELNKRLIQAITGIAQEPTLATEVGSALARTDWTKDANWRPEGRDYSYLVPDNPLPSVMEPEAFAKEVFRRQQIVASIEGMPENVHYYPAGVPGLAERYKLQESFDWYKQTTAVDQPVDTLRRASGQAMAETAISEAKSGYGDLFIAVDSEGRFAGALNFSREVSPEYGNVLNIEYLGASAPGSGAGTRLDRAVKAIARYEGADDVIIPTALIEAVPFYERMGFSAVSEEDFSYTMRLGSNLYASAEDVAERVTVSAVEQVAGVLKSVQTATATAEGILRGLEAGNLDEWAALPWDHPADALRWDQVEQAQQLLRETDDYLSEVMTPIMRNSEKWGVYGEELLGASERLDAIGDSLDDLAGRIRARRAEIEKLTADVAADNNDILNGGFGCGS